MIMNISIKTRIIMLSSTFVLIWKEFLQIWKFFNKGFYKHKMCLAPISQPIIMIFQCLMNNKRKMSLDVDEFSQNKLSSH